MIVLSWHFVPSGLVFFYSAANKHNKHSKTTISQFVPRPMVYSVFWHHISIHTRTHPMLTLLEITWTVNFLILFRTVVISQACLCLHRKGRFVSVRFNPTLGWSHLVESLTVTRRTSVSISLSVPDLWNNTEDDLLVVKCTKQLVVGLTSDCIRDVGTPVVTVQRRDCSYDSYGVLSWVWPLNMLSWNTVSCCRSVKEQPVARRQDWLTYHIIQHIILNYVLFDTHYSLSCFWQ